MRKINIIIAVLSVCAFASCKQEASAPVQPDFITVNLAEPFSAQVGDMFEMSVPEQEDAAEYLWIVPESINIIEGNGTPKILVTGLASGVITAGTIRVYAVNSIGESIPRILYKEITIIPMPEKPGFIKCSIAGSMVAFFNDEVKFSIDEDEMLESVQWTVPEGCVVLSEGLDELSVILKAPSRVVRMLDKDAVGVRVVYKSGVEQEYTWKKPIYTADPAEAKRYGSKVWTLRNLNYAGIDGTVGRTYPGDDNGEKYGRYYTWEEAMTGSSSAECPYTYGATGTDDMGNAYTLTDGLNAWNIQIQGICPEGWHVPNAYDFYDLAVGVADDYGLRVGTINDCVNRKAGIFLPDLRSTAPMTAMNLITYGFISSYLRGSRPASEGGMWAAHSNQAENGTMFNLSKASGAFPAGTYPMYFPGLNEEIGFNILPCGQFNGDSAPVLGTYSFHWTATLTSSGTSYRFTIGNNSCNLSTYAQAHTYGCNLRCVANY